MPKRPASHQGYVGRFPASWLDSVKWQLVKCKLPQGANGFRLGNHGNGHMPTRIFPPLIAAVGTGVGHEGEKWDIPRSEWDALRAGSQTGLLRGDVGGLSQITGIASHFP